MSKEMIARNGDTLAALNALKCEADTRLQWAEAELREAEAKLEPLRAVVREKRMHARNVGARLNVWWNEYREKYGPPRDPPRLNGGIIGSAPTMEDLKPTPEETEKLRQLLEWQEQSARSPIVLGHPQQAVKELKG